MPNGTNVRIRRGYDIKLVGGASKTISTLPVSDFVAVKPDDFKAIIPKLDVQAGDEVKVGQSLFHDKLRPEIHIPSPVSGEVIEIIRGAKRHILEVRILPDKSQANYMDFGKGAPAILGRDVVVRRLLESGIWSYIRQRPFDVIADPTVTPKAIHVSCFDSAPLAPDMDYIIAQNADAFKTGLEALCTLAGSRLHLGVQKGQTVPHPADAIVDTFSGPHPAGNVGIQIHHTNPISKGDVIWYVHPQDVIIIGRLFLEGHYRAERMVAVSGSCVKDPQYFKVISGQTLGSILNGRLSDSHSRIIQGNVLTGAKSDMDAVLSYYCNQLSVIPEGDKPEFLGWLTPGFGKLSLSGTFFSWLFKDRQYNLDTNLHGEERNFVVTGQYEKVLPMNIMPVFLLKSIMARDLEGMEALGIYEVSEEDFALCEFVCTSKIDVQNIIAEGLEYARREG